MGDGCGCSFLPSAARPISGTAGGPRCASISEPSQQYLAVSRLTEDPPPHLQVMVHTAFTNNQCKKQEKHPKYHNSSAEAPGTACSTPAAQRVWTLALTSAPWATCAGSSLFPSGGALAAGAKGFRLITRSSLSPASEIRGTARQQSKSLVRMRFTCRDGI